MTVVFVGVRDVFVKWFLLECKLQDKRRESQHLTRVERSLYAIKQGVNWCLHGNNVTWERGRFTLLKDSSCLLRELPNNSKHGFLCSIYIQSIYYNIINTKREMITFWINEISSPNHVYDSFELQSRHWNFDFY